MKARVPQLVLGFVLAGLGLYSLILMMVGVQVQPLVWLDNWGALTGFVLRLLMIMAGATLIALSTTNWARERAEIEAARKELENDKAGSKAEQN